MSWTPEELDRQVGSVVEVYKLIRMERRRATIQELEKQLQRFSSSKGVDSGAVSAEILKALLQALL